MASLALGADGEYYNVNADEMASACAVACRADALVFLTDVAGVKGASGSIVRRLATSEIPALVRSSVIGGGMLPKLEACQRALRSGVVRVLLLPAVQADVLPGFPESVVGLGSEVIGDDSPRSENEETQSDLTTGDQFCENQDYRADRDLRDASFDRMLDNWPG